MTTPNATQTSPLYAVIDLGSNSFHMLITRLVADGVQTVDKVKRKVRLASGLDKNNNLSDEAMSRGLECLSFFAERLQDIAPENIRIVATATLRIANNANEFLDQAKQVLKRPVTLLSGIEEAERIYLGVAHTSSCSAKRLVIDIGGASTEIIVGEHFSIHQAISLNMGCVTFNQQFFADGRITLEQFDDAVAHAKSQLLPFLESYSTFGWQTVLGGSGTMQALAEILVYQNKPAIITLPFMQSIAAQLMNIGEIKLVNIDGLPSDRVPVLASGLAILIAIFESFDLSALQLSSGAIREGLLYEMLPDMRKLSIRTRTINSLVERFHIDEAHADRVTQQAMHLYDCYAEKWQLNDDNLKQVLASACRLHEVGLLLSYKYHQHHGAYIIQHADLPGYDQTERQLMVALIKQYKGDIDADSLQQLAITEASAAAKLLAIFRLAVILCRRRKGDVLPKYQTNIEGKAIMLCLSPTWVTQHPLIADELLQENKHLASINLKLVIAC
ncbi:guanosine-5'-triphosphate,3'-diphosphate pyrophosphatase [Thalassotalea sp. M1531]|uniref:Guanosine-5'-triphosphate,3'-diphosphate pyrophosphatase n=1 Tax=Thalassotalea algicola TaxID=2716224 RepID=A0A7Y0LAL2_9GAMM|nr:guanosine-5'-triphosphate,3'-diphosphate pyrophosphatase [Thalassotalea algicola]NMP30734.1 guanosine-5'-triphosphate,3'-diphosphate pyrophosphatase [Thalassotalea algicola]